jgi:hypothetical protein
VVRLARLVQNRSWCGLISICDWIMLHTGFFECYCKTPPFLKKYCKTPPFFWTLRFLGTFPPKYHVCMFAMFACLEISMFACLQDDWQNGNWHGN